MIRLILFVAFSAGIGPVLAAPLDGRWAWDKAACANEPGSGDVGPSVFAGDTVTHYESRCTIENMTPIGTQESAWQVDMACVGEGEEFAKKSIFALNRDQAGKPRQLIEIDLDDGFVIVRHACD